MMTVLVRGWWPASVGIPNDEVNEKVVKEYCVRAAKYRTETDALMSYAECMTDWSTLLDEDADIEQFCNDAVSHIISHDYDWLEQHFV